MTDIKLNINIVGNPRGVKMLETNKELSALSVANGGGTTITAENGLFPTIANEGKKCFVVGVTPLGSTQYTLTAERGYKGYITRDVADFTWEMTTGGVDVFYIKFEFDRMAQQYPATIKAFDVGGAEIATSTTQTDTYTYLFESSTPARKFTFADWAKTDYPACITNIESVPSEFSFTKRNIETILSSAESQSEASSIQYGVIASNGTITLLDTFSEVYGDYLLHEYARQGWINRNTTELVLSLNGRNIRHAIIESTATYDEAEKQLTIPITDKLSSFAELQIPDIVLSSINGDTQPISLLALLTHLLTKYGGLKETEYELSRQIVVGDGTYTEYQQMAVSEYLGSFFVPTVDSTMLNADTLANDISKICTVAQLNCYCVDNVVVFDTARPIAIDDSILQRCVIPTNLQNSTFAFSIIINNNYNKVAFSDESVVNVTNADTLYTVQSNELFVAGTYQSIPSRTAREILRANILADYRNGIFSGEIEIMLGTDIYDRYGAVFARYANGELIQPHTILQLYKDIQQNDYVVDSEGRPFFWKVTSATFDWNGNPKMRLKVMQILPTVDDLPLFYTSENEAFVTSDDNYLTVRRN